MCKNEDILRIIPDENIPKLRDKYKQFFPRAAHVYNFLNCIIKWKKQRPEEDYATLCAPYGDWSNGTFIAIQKWSLYSLSVCTLDKNHDVLYTALVNTKRIEWDKLMVLAVTKDHVPAVLRALHTVKFPTGHSNTYDVWWMSKEKAVKLKVNESSSDVYVKTLEDVHTTIINSHWPYKFPGAEKYLATFIELNGGYGVFLKTCNALVAWILKNQMGLGALETIEEYRRKGYGSLITKCMARKIANDGEDALGMVRQTNIASQAMFKKLGFEIVESITFIESKLIE